MEEPAVFEEFLRLLQGHSFQERYFRWESYLNQLKDCQSHYYRAVLEKFLDHYPFNHSSWIHLVQLTLAQPTGKVNAFKVYNLALQKNPKSVPLWKHYLQWLTKETAEKEPEYLKQEYDKAALKIGTHFHGGFVYEFIFKIEESAVELYKIMKKALISPLQNIEQIYESCNSVIDSPVFSIAQMEEILKSEGASLPQIRDNTAYARELREILKVTLRKLYDLTRKHVESRLVFEEKIACSEYKPYCDSIENWKAYLNFIRSSGNPEFLIPTYQRALITLCDKVSLWEDYFSLMETKGQTRSILELFRTHETFFKNLSRDFTYYWLEIEERENQPRARELYMELEKTEYHLETFVKHIQLEIRCKEFNNARAIFESLPRIFSANHSLVTAILLEHAQFQLKYGSDPEAARNVLTTHFNTFPYNEELFLGLLEFYQKHMQYKEKEGKENCDKFINILVSGLQRALDSEPNRYPVVSRIANKLLRKYIKSIFLIKSAEKRVKQYEIKMRRGLADHAEVREGRQPLPEPTPSKIPHNF